MFANVSAMANPIIYAFTRDDLRKVAHTMFRRFLYKFYSSGISSRCGPKSNGSPAVTKSTRDSSYSSNSTKVVSTFSKFYKILNFYLILRVVQFLRVVAVKKCFDLFTRTRSHTAHFIFEIILRKNRIRYRTPLDFEWSIISLSNPNQMNITSLKFSRYISDPNLSDLDFTKWLGSELPLKWIQVHQLN